MNGTLLGHQRLRSACTKTQPLGHTASPAFCRRRHNRYRNRTYPPAQQKPHTPPLDNSPQGGQSPPAYKGAEPPSATAIIQHLAKPFTTRDVPDN